jgi:hypothetical protein
MQCGCGGAYERWCAVARTRRLCAVVTSLHGNAMECDAVRCGAVRCALPDFAQVDRTVRKAVPPKGLDESLSMHQSIFVGL